jgi:hypothetical protein
MFCPRCKYEYKEGLTDCPDCGIPMVDLLIEHGGGATTPDGTWVELCTVTAGLKSTLIKGALDSSNIPSEVVPDEFSSRNRGLSESLRRKDLEPMNNIILVPDEFREDAASVLEAVLGDGFLGCEQ